MCNNFYIHLYFLIIYSVLIRITNEHENFYDDLIEKLKIRFISAKYAYDHESDTLSAIKDPDLTGISENLLKKTKDSAIALVDVYQTVITGSINETAMEYPPEKRDKYIHFMQDILSRKMIADIIIKSTIKEYSPNDIDVLHKYRGSKAYQSYMRKMLHHDVVFKAFKEAFIKDVMKRTAAAG